MMAPKAADQKRKRGTTDAPRAVNGAARAQTTLTTDGRLSRPARNAEDDENDDETRPEKRSKTGELNRQREQQPLGATNGNPPSGRRPATSTRHEDAESGSSRASGAPRKTKPDVLQESSERPDPDTSQPRTKGPRRSDGFSKGNAVAEDQDYEDDEDDDDDEEEEPEQKTKKRGRSSLAAASNAEDTDTQPVQKKRGRPRGSGNGSAKRQSMPKKQSRASQSNQDGEAASQKKRKRKSAEVSGEEDQASQTDRSTWKRTKGRSSDGSQSSRRSSRTLSTSRRSSNESETSPRSYRYLEAQICKISRDTIDNKWSPLDVVSIDSVTSLLQSAARPVLLQLKNIEKQNYATTVIEVASRRIRRRLERGMPFPRAQGVIKREDELQFEHTLDGVRALEAQLNPLLHSVELLKREEERARSELERDYKVLRTLSKNAAADARGKRDRLRKLHPLVAPIKQEDEDKSDALDMMGELAPPAVTAGKMLAAGMEDDEELMGLAEQIGRNMESMRGNLRQIDGVGDAVARSRAALKLALLSHLDQAQLDQVNFG